MMQRSESGPLAVQIRLDRAQHSGTTIRMEEHRTLRRVSNSGFLSAANIAAGPANSADAAQAGLFEGILQAEIAQLRQMAMVMIPRVPAKSTRDRRPPRSFTELTARMEEVHRLLTALRDRFPERAVLGAPSERAVSSPKNPVTCSAR